MIKVARLDGVKFTINADPIELIETTPNTVMSLTTGKKRVVRESFDEVIARVIAYWQRTGAPLSCWWPDESAAGSNWE
jgi:flagellar protein FlbD